MRGRNVIESRLHLLTEGLQIDESKIDEWWATFDRTISINNRTDSCHPSIARITYSSIFGRSIKARLMQTRLYVSREAIRAPSTVAHAYLARGPCPPRCGSRSRFSRTEANPRFRIPYAVAYREGPQALSPPPLSLWGPTCLPTERSKAKSRDNSRLETRYEFVNG